jgi:large subunit ribosomal protein L9
MAAFAAEIIKVKIMDVVLNEDVKKLGYRGDVVNVKSGYFRNFLLPRGLADAATRGRLALAEKRNEKRVMAKQQILDNSKDILAKLEGLVVTLKEKVNDKGHLYAAVSESEVIEAVKAAANVELDASMLKMEHFKEVGEHKVTVSLGSSAEVEIGVTVEGL